MRDATGKQTKRVRICFTSSLRVYVTSTSGDARRPPGEMTATQIRQEPDFIAAIGVMQLRSGSLTIERQFTDFVPEHLEAKERR